MKRLLTYFTALLLLAGAAGVWSAFSAAEAGFGTTSGLSADRAEDRLSETGSAFVFDLPQEMLAPTNQAAGASMQENRVPVSAPRSGFSPCSGYLSRHTGRDYHTDYALTEAHRQTLLPYRDPTLEYVFRLRHIII
jgi:hypothetical protein